MFKSKAFCAVAACISLGALASPSVAQNCVDSGMKQIRSLGSNSVSSKPLNTRAEMVTYLESIRSEIDSIMERKGVDGHTDALFAALRSGEGVTESELQRGQTVEWMIFRQNGRVAVGRGPYCLDTSERYPTFEVEIVEEEDLGSSVKRTTSTFIIPKICANVALGDVRTETVAKPQPVAPPVTPKPVAPKVDPAPPAPPPTPAPPVVAPPVVPTPPSSTRDSRWTVRGFPLRMNVDDDAVTTDSGSERTRLSLSGGNGAGANVEYRPNPRLGIEAGLLFAGLDSLFIFDSETEWLKDTDSLDFRALTVGPNFHLTPDAKVDFYIGPFIGLAQFDDTSFNIGGNSVNRDLDDEFMFGAQVGLDVPFGSSPWALHVGGLFMDVSAAGNGFDLDVSPLIGTVGLAYNF